jgi:hypothetical protein
MVSFFFLFSKLSWALPNITWSELYALQEWEELTQQHSDVGTIIVYRGFLKDFPCFVGKTTTTISPDLLLSIASQAEEAIKWSSAGVTEAKELNRTPEYVDYYQYLDVPVFSDRYWILRGFFTVETTDKGDKKIFHWDKISQEYPEIQKQIQDKNPYALEPIINVGAWAFEPTDKEGTMLLSYYICSHPGGSVPVALQSIATEKTLPNNIKDILTEGKKRSK